MNIAFIGLGIMGSRMAANLHKAGFSITVTNRSKDKATALIDAGAIWADSPAEAAKTADIVITMVANPAVVKELATGDNGFLDHMHSNALWIDCSTVNPSFSREMAALATSQNIRFLDAPVAGTKGPAEKGELVFLVGGEASDVAQAQLLFDVMGKKTAHLGAHGMGSSMKMVVNQMLGTTMAVFSEAMLLGQALGLEEATLLNVLTNSPVSPAYLGVIRGKLENSEYSANFPLYLMHKDLHLATKSAYEKSLPMPVTAGIEAAYAEANSAGNGDMDFSSIYGFLKKKAGQS